MTHIPAGSDSIPYYNQTYYSARLERLIAKAQNQQWAADTGVNWNQTPVLPAGVAVNDYLDMMSQLYHAEIYVVEFCARLVTRVPDLQAKRFLSTQIHDEARHVQAYARYIQLFGDILPVNEKLRALFDGALAWQGPCLGWIVAVNILLEGEALNQQNMRIRTLPCPIFKEMYSRITTDESRHTAFGIIYLADKVPTLDPAERAAIVAWVSSLWRGWEKANEGRYAEESARILRTSSEELRSRFGEQLKTLKKIGLIDDPVTV
jgi:1,2-phenylacetyl-CoA epoxidase catalytic subunit